MSASPGFDSRPMHENNSSCEHITFVLLLLAHTFWLLAGLGSVRRQDFGFERYGMEMVIRLSALLTCTSALVVGNVHVQKGIHTRDRVLYTL
jgi:hypothetical protein